MKNAARRLWAALSAAANSYLSTDLSAHPATRGSAMVVLPSASWPNQTPAASRPATGVWDGRRDERTPLSV
ncbi:hypothetical protein ACQBAT_09485 [Ornithinimicrobium sp. Y1847]|uniref:hypothetical protein n=1 Tax=Ornithinimicrobium sp. Y1847 TaxID=3405419 RepID=UPI003B683803